MPLDFTEQQRRALSTRLMVQAPAGLSPSQLAAIARDYDQKIAGLPGDKVMALDALRLLADQGNDFAGDLFMDECDALGLTTKTYSFGRR